MKTFAWEAIREVIIDRLEGSRRSLRGHEKEIIVRTAVMVAVQTYFSVHGDYGIYSGIQTSPSQIRLDNETFDVGIQLISALQTNNTQILIPIKTRETEGGGHAHLFTRDIMSAISTAKRYGYCVIAVIVAQNWALREAANIRAMVDHICIVDRSPQAFQGFSESMQHELNEFISGVLSGKLTPKIIKSEDQ